MIDELSRLIPLLHQNCVSVFAGVFFNMVFDFFTLPGDKLSCLIIFLCVSS